ncbi:MAG: HAD family phosphatase [Alphaproteobacteria bacterium]|nr:HAD family phosphatase [Alphaproteobacteria bacterium]
MRPIAALPAEWRRRIKYVLVDIDDTLTSRGRLTAAAYGALERLQQSGREVIPVTGRPAGWCDMIARFWPVAAVIGENGAFYFRYDHGTRTMIGRYWLSAEEQAAARRRLDALAVEILAAVPAARVAADQPYRRSDLAIDVREDVAALPPADIDRILAIFHDAGAHAKLSSIHVNGWFGDFDKLAMTRCLFAEIFGVELDRVRDEVAFAGDSPNDEPMFAYFPHAVAVANIRDHLPRLKTAPAYVTQSAAGEGFVELADLLVG